MTALPAGVDDAGQQGEDLRAGGGAGALADLAGDHPVPQRPLRDVVGQREFGMVQHLEDRVPVVEQLHRQCVGLGVRVALVLLAGRTQLGQEGGVLGREVGGRAFPRGVHRRHQGVEGVAHLAAEGPHVALVALHQALRLAQAGAPSTAAGAGSGGRRPSRRSSASR